MIAARYSLLLVITSIWLLPRVTCDLFQISTMKEFEKLKSTAPLRVSLVYKVKPGCGRSESFAVHLQNLLELISARLDAMDMKVRITYTDCEANPVKDLCGREDSGDAFFNLLLTDKDREEVLLLEPDEPLSDVRDLLGRILEFYAKTWKTVSFIHNAKQVRQTIVANPQRDWFVCYGNKENNIGKLFCLEFAANFHKRPAIGTIFVEQESVLGELKKSVGAELQLDQTDPSPLFGLWYLDCLEDDGVECKAYQYLMDESIENAKQFVKTIRYPPLVEIMPDGTIPDLREHQCSLLYFFYRGIKLRWDEAKTKAFEVGRKLRGTAIVAAADIDYLEQSTLEALGVDVKNGKFPSWKLKLQSSKLNKTYDQIDGCPVAFIKRLLKSTSDKSRSPHTKTDSDEVAPSPGRQKTGEPIIQDDEVELMLEAQRDQSCYFCPPDFKRVTVLTDKTYRSFIEKKNVAMVLFWLNVDTMSRAVLSTTIEASTMLDANTAPFGAVACHDWPDVCEKAQVRTWPRMMVFINGQRGREYKAVWDAKLLANSAMLYAASQVTQISSAKELEKFIQGKTIPLANGTFLQTITVGLFKNEKSRQIHSLKEAAKRLHGQYAFGVVAASWVKKWVDERMGPLELPVIVTHKNNDDLEKAVLMDDVEEATPESIIRFVQKSSRPVIAALNKVTFTSIINRKVPVVALIGSKPRETEFFAVLRNVEECLLSNNYVCVTLDSDEERNLTTYLLKAYDLENSELPVVTYVNPKNGHVHVMKKSASKKSIKTWLEHINSDLLKPSVILPEKSWTKPPLVYDYLKMSTVGMSQCEKKGGKDGQAGNGCSGGEPVKMPAEKKMGKGCPFSMGMNNEEDEEQHAVPFDYDRKHSEL